MYTNPYEGWSSARPLQQPLGPSAAAARSGSVVNTMQAIQDAMAMRDRRVAQQGQQIAAGAGAPKAGKPAGPPGKPRMAAAPADLQQLMELLRRMQEEQAAGGGVQARPGQAPGFGGGFGISDGVLRFPPGTEKPFGGSPPDMLYRAQPGFGVPAQPRPGASHQMPDGSVMPGAQHPAKGVIDSLTALLGAGAGGGGAPAQPAAQPGYAGPAQPAIPGDVLGRRRQQGQLAQMLARLRGIA